MAITAVNTCRAEEITPTQISRLIDQRLGIDNIDQSRFATDAAFLRRVTLDLAGRIPTIVEVHDYLGNTSESRRNEAINRLMHSGVHYRNMATFWRRSWVPQADTPEFDSVTDNFERWLVHRLQQGTRYDNLVVEILTLDQSGVSPDSITPVGFYDANLSKPENLAASSTRAFLGINLDCAQCHDHPFSRWTREQFWQTAAFFAPPEMGKEDRPQPPKVRIPDTKLEFEPALLSKTEIKWPRQLDSVSLRLILVDWMKANQEQLLAKNAVNRLWAHFFGEAIIEPIDDLSRDEFQTGPRAKLLSVLSQAFIDSGYNLETLIEGIAGSHAYRLSTAPPTATVAKTVSGEDKKNDAALHIVKSTVRGLTGEQLYDSLQTAAGLPSERHDVRGGSERSQRSEFSTQFHIQRAHSAERSITQSLTLMNGTFVNELTSKEGNLMLASLLSSPFMTSAEQTDTVFIAVLGRHAKPAELLAVERSFKSHPDTSREQHLGNLFWALINSSEFNTNH
ncbi:hypothetical protein Enr10x_12510 [Gimesia panareensis]|uniref:DUF1549 domain-containing protein n=1 Tax=Gimesia panareensis TaxID=2527978 RepID=A0A517Q2V4_9PLAN|nr:DUF1549 domain-containing protein [Gimesia panareensis]QDT25953.1 hypothetical protein Enr10x_12510 [Gimesia panareensis]